MEMLVKLSSLWGKLRASESASFKDLVMVLLLDMHFWHLLTLGTLNFTWRERESFIIELGCRNVVPHEFLKMPWSVYEHIANILVLVVSNKSFFKNKAY